MIKILVVDDELDLASQLTEILNDDGYKTQYITNPEETFKAIEVFEPNIVIMDKLMPERNGLDVVKDLRGSSQHESIPIIMLTACKTKKDLMECFESGVDDFIAKPFDYEELKLRITALYNRTNNSAKRLLKFENIYIDTLAQTVFVNENEVTLTLTEYKLLKALMSNINKVLDRASLCEEALGGKNVIHRTIDVHVTSLRKKLEDASNVIQTVRGVGYKITDNRQAALRA